VLYAFAFLFPTPAQVTLGIVWGKFVKSSQMAPSPKGRRQLPPCASTQLCTALITPVLFRFACGCLQAFQTPRKVNDAAQYYELFSVSSECVHLHLLADVGVTMPRQEAVIAGNFCHKHRGVVLKKKQIKSHCSLAQSPRY